MNEQDLVNWINRMTTNPPSMSIPSSPQARQPYDPLFGRPLKKKKKKPPFTAPAGSVVMGNASSMDLVPTYRRPNFMNIAAGLGRY